MPDRYVDTNMNTDNRQMQQQQQHKQMSTLVPHSCLMRVIGLKEKENRPNGGGK